jgi:ubiquinone biosynthesis protein
MFGLIRFILLIVLFAWMARALLGARELTWRRTVAAAVIGLAFGGLAAALILTDDLESVAEVDADQLEALAIPLSILATMGALVVLEAFFASQRRRGFSPLSPFRSVRRWFGMWVRGFQVSRILIRHGLGPILGLSRRRDDSPRGPTAVSRAVRVSLEEAGGMFVKLGQLLVTRPDLLPPDALAELGKLHADVAPIPGAQVREIVESETGGSLEETFSEFTWKPLGSASIGQAHPAQLDNGREVVVKVRRPGLEKQVERDLAIVRWLARIAEQRTTWGADYRVRDLAEEFATALQDELHFTIEAKHAAEMTESEQDHPDIVVPEIVDRLTTDRMLVMEKINGVPLSQMARDGIPTDHRQLADELCRSQVEAMLRGHRFHGDPHPGNVLLLEDGRLGLVDFGITGRLDVFEQASVFEMLIALELEDPVVLFDGLMTIGAVGPEHDPDRVERSLAQFLAEHVSTGLPRPEALTALLRLTTEMGLHMPPSTTTMFRALATLAGTLETLSPGYPLLDVVGDIGGAEMRRKATPESVREFVEQEWAQLGPLFRRAPKHLDRIATQLEHGGLSGSVRLFAHPGDAAVLERLLNRAVTAFLSVGLGAVSVVLLTIDSRETTAEVNFFDIIGWAGLSMAVILLLRVLLEVFRAGTLEDTGRR